MKVKVTIGKKVRYLPTSFADIEPKILFRLAPYIYQAKPEKILALSLLLQIDIATINRFSEDDRYDLIQIISFLFKPSEQQPFPFVELKGKKYLLPQSDFADVCLGEFTMANIFFNLYLQTQNEKFLDRLFAELCREEHKEKDYKTSTNWNGSKRQAYNGKIAELNEPIFAKLKQEHKAALLNYFVGCKLSLVKKYNAIFDEPEPSDTKAPQAQYDYKQDTFLKLINTLSKTGQYGDYEKTGLQNIHIILLNLCQDKLNPVKAPSHEL